MKKVAFKGSTSDARLVHDSGINVALQERTGKEFRIRRAALSESDQRYLNAMRPK